MTQVVRCVWRLFDVEDFFEAVNLGRTLECTIWLDTAFYDESDYSLTAVLIAAEEETFLLTYGNTLNLYGYVECFACEYVDLAPEQLNPEDAVHLIRGDVFIGSLIQTCEWNRQIREEPLLWILTEFEMGEVNRSNLEKLSDVLENPQIMIFYERGSIRFYFKILKFPGFRKRLNEIKILLHLKYWHLLTVQRMLSVAKWVEGLPQLTLDTLDTVLSEVGKYQ
jgi:hypothetical protein